MQTLWNVTAKHIEGILFDVFVNDRFYRRVKWDKNKLVKVQNVPSGSQVYYPSITEIEQACDRAHQ